MAQAVDIPRDISPGDLLKWIEYKNRTVELSLAGRRILAETHDHPDPTVFRCERDILSYVEIITRSREEVLSLLTQQRQCRYFFPYLPGFSPQQHLDLEREHRTNILLVKATIIATIIGAIIGAAAVLIDHHL
jgi:hypothetical protein